MKKAEGIIFDMDGCLYSFDKGTSQTFGQSQFSRELHRNIVAFFQNRFELDPEEALKSYRDFSRRFNGEISLGLEQECDVSRGEYFAATWNINPQKFVERYERLIPALGRLSIRRGLLSAAPRIWVDKVLNHLDVKDLFEPAIFSGDPNIRKPHPEAFLQVARFWGVPPESLISIGDQEETDILPAKQLGMATVRVGKDSETEADFVATDVVDAINILKKEKII